MVGVIGCAQDLGRVDVLLLLGPGERGRETIGLPHVVLLALVASLGIEHIPGMQRCGQIGRPLGDVVGQMSLSARVRGR